MPVSDIENLTPIMREVRFLNPKTVLDVGIGYGKYGALCREVLDIAQGRLSIEPESVFITGVEAHVSYRSPLWKCYDAVYIMDAVEFLNTPRAPVDLTLAIDVIEHLYLADGLALLQKLVEGSKRVIMSVPLGECPQGAVHGNIFERHRTTWTSSMINSLPYSFTIVKTGGAQGTTTVISIKGLG